MNIPYRVVLPWGRQPGLTNSQDLRPHIDSANSRRERTDVHGALAQRIRLEWLTIKNHEEQVQVGSGNKTRIVTATRLVIRDGGARTISSHAGRVVALKVSKPETTKTKDETVEGQQLRRSGGTKGNVWFTAAQTNASNCIIKHCARACKTQTPNCRSFSSSLYHQCQGRARSHTDAPWRSRSNRHERAHGQVTSAGKAHSVKKVKGKDTEMGGNGDKGTRKGQTGLILLARARTPSQTVSTSINRGKKSRHHTKSPNKNTTKHAGHTPVAESISAVLT